MKKVFIVNIFTTNIRFGYNCIIIIKRKVIAIKALMFLSPIQFPLYIIVVQNWILLYKTYHNNMVSFFIYLSFFILIKYINLNYLKYFVLNINVVFYTRHVRIVQWVAKIKFIFSLPII